VTSHDYFFQGIKIKKSLATAITMGLVAALINSLADVNLHRTAFFDWLEFAQNLSLYSSCCLLGLIFAEKTSLECFLLQRKGSWTKKGAAILLLGLALGGIIGITYHRLFAQYRFSPRVPYRLRAMETHYDSFILSLRAGVTEELVFRFLLFTAFFYILKRLFDPLVAHGFAAAKWIPFLFSVLLSSLLFGVAHGTYGFLVAFLAGILLGIAYFRGGLECAILAHFVADFVFFSMTYL
jgi:membrane protease YdiL (CAAX protease family)